MSFVKRVGEGGCKILEASGMLAIKTNPEAKGLLVGLLS